MNRETIIDDIQCNNKERHVDINCYHMDVVIAGK